MPQQPAFPSLRDAIKKKATRREQVLAELDAVVPRVRLLALIEPDCPEAGPQGGRPPMPLETMPRVCFLSNRYAPGGPMAEGTLHHSEAMRRFAGIEPGDDRIPGEPTILNFRHLLEQHGLTEAILANLNPHLADKGVSLRPGILVDATIIDAPSSIRNKARAHGPEVSSTKKGNDRYSGSEEDQNSIEGIKFPTSAHIGVDADSGVIYSLQTPAAKQHDSQARDELLHGEETSARAPSRAFRHALPGNGQRPYQCRALGGVQGTGFQTNKAIKPPFRRSRTC